MHRLWRVLQWLLFIAVMGLMVGYLRRYWGEISSIAIRCDWVHGGAALLLVLLSNLLQIVLFRYFLRHNGLALDLLSAWRIFSIPQLGKYIPGKVAAVAALSYMLTTAGLSVPHALAVVFIFNIVALLSSLLVGLLVVPVWASHMGPVTVGLFLACAILGVPAVCTRTFWHFVNLALVRFGRPPLPDYPARHAMIRLMLGWILYWLVLGAGVGAATGFLVEVPGRSFLLLVPAFSLACFISNISFIAPAGFGVREALLVGMIGAASALGAVFAAVSRVVMLLNDLMMIGGAWLFVRKRPVRQTKGA